MGTNFLNYYVFPFTAKAEIVSGVKRYFKSEGYVQASREEEDADVQIKACERKGKPAFISVEGSDASNLGEFARGLSETLERDVLGAAVWDSDLLVIHFHSHSSNKTTELSNGCPLHEEDYLRSDYIDVLMPLLTNEDNQSELIRIWEADYTFAEERLSDLLTLFGCDGNWDYQIAQARNLSFKHQSDEERGYAIIKEGMPKLRLSSKDVMIANGEACYISFRNTGGPSKGLSVVLRGGLIKELGEDSSVFAPASLWAYTNPSPLHTLDNSPERYYIEAELSAVNIVDDEIGFIARFPDVEIPNGLWIDYDRKYSQKPVWEKFGSYYEMGFHFTISVANPRALEGLKLQIIIAPLENWTEGQAGYEVTFWSSSEAYYRENPI